MNAMMAAFQKAAEKDPEMKNLVTDANILMENLLEERRKRKDVWKKMMEDNVWENKEKEDAIKQKLRDEAEIQNRNKPIWEWIARPDKYSFDCGFIFADTEQEARETIAKYYNPSVKVTLKLCDCSRSMVLIASHYE